MEAAIAWLVQTILATLLIDKLDAWIRQVGLADDVEKLKSEVERVEMVVGGVRGRAAGNRLLARSLARLNELLYEAYDVIDELDYYRLQQQVLGVTVDDPQGVPAAEPVDGPSTGNADMPLDDTSSSRGVKRRKKWSKAWENFNVTEEDQNGKPLIAACKHCLTPIKCAAKDGTSGMLNHNKVCQKKPAANDQPPNPSSAGDATETTMPIVIADSSGRKRRREDEVSAQITVPNTYTPWDKAEISNSIQKITSQLQDVRGEVSEVLKLHGSNSASSSNQQLNTASDQHLRTSSLLSRTVYGRVAEKISTKNLILEDRSDGVRVLPIVGIAGVGKTALAQFVYNDPEVETKFNHRIWVWVSRNFDEVRLTREMLDFVSQKRHEGISSFAKLQEILKSHASSKRLLLIFDDIWDDMKYCQWDKLLAPFRSGQGNGIVVLVTTRSLSVAERLGTLKPVKLGPLEHDDFGLLFKSCAFGDGIYEGPSKLSTVGLKIAEKLKGNPLAAVSVGALLRKYLTVDHWSNILRKEDWKSLGLSEGIMPALKLSYDQLPYHLQQCFSCCSIFPYNYKFIGKELVYIWMSQGFVNTSCLTKRLEETGWEYLTDLVNLGFFQQVEQEEEFSPDSQIWYSACGLMHDFAKKVSSTQCATIDDGLQYIKMLPTIHHLSILTGSAYCKDQDGKIPRNEKFEENLRNTIASVSKLRMLVLLGRYDSFFLQLLKDIFRKAKNLRMVQIYATSADFNSLMCSLADPTHLRYLKYKSDGFDRPLPVVLIRFFHLQVLDVGSNNDPGVPDGMNNLVSLRHLVAGNGVYSSVANIGSMTSLQELHNFKVQPLSGSFEISQLQSMNELVKLWVSQLDNVESREEAYGAGLRDKVHLAKLHLSWKDALSDEEYSSGYSYESSEELTPMEDGGPSSEPSMGTAREVLEGLEPHMNLKHLQISGYNGATSPTWLASNIPVTSLQTLHLDGCRGWRILPSLESLPFIRKLKLRNMQEVTEVLVPSLEEIVLIRMPKLVRCSSTSVEGLSSVLRALEIEECQELKEFDLFENDGKLETRQRSWLPGLRNLVLSHCPHLKVSKPLPPSTTVSELLIRRVSALSLLYGASSEKLQIGCLDDVDEYFDASCDELRILDDKILAFQNLRNLKSMSIEGCRNLAYIAFKGFSHFVSLKNLEISMCKQLFSLDVMPEHTLEDGTASDGKPFPSLVTLSITSCGITGKWLSLLLRHAPGLEELHLEDILSTEMGGSSLGEEDDALTGLAQDGLVHIPLNLISSLKKITIDHCHHLTFNCSEEGFSGFTSLQGLIILGGCAKLLSSFVHKDGNGLTSLKKLVVEWSPLESLQQHSCTALEELTIEYCGSLIQLEGLQSLGSLKRLGVERSPGLKSLQLHSCTALEELKIKYCGSFFQLEGLQSLGRLRHLAVSDCSGLGPCLEGFSRQGCELFPQLETLETDDPSVLTMSFCNHLTSLRRLQLRRLVLSEEQGGALVLLTSLQELEFNDCPSLLDLPAGLHLLTSLKSLKISYCRRISRLPETGLPLSLEELKIDRCSEELADQCRGKATSKLRVNIV
ncbi:hypothetical protein ACQ4PT_066053 [Festuca glaucescens]